MLHLGFEPVGDLTEEVVAGVTAVDAVVAVGVGELTEVFVGLHQCFCVFGGISEVHIIVGKSVTDEQIA